MLRNVKKIIDINNYLLQNKRFLTILKDGRGMEFSFHSNSNDVNHEEKIDRMNDAVETFAARSNLFYGDSREKFIDVLRSNDNDHTTFDRNPIALCGLGLSTYFQTKYHAHDNNSKLLQNFGGLYKCLDDTSVILKEEESTLGEIEMLHINAFHYTILGNYTMATKLYEYILRHINATDLISIRTLYEIYSSTGNIYNMKTFITRVLPYWDHNTPGYVSVMAMHADGLAESGNYIDAEEASMRALSMDSSKSEMAIGVVCKCYLGHCKPREGLRFLREIEDQWGDADSIPRSISWWRALFYLEQGNDELALHQIDVNFGTTEGREGRPIVINDFVSSAFIFWLLYMRKVDITERLLSFSENYIDLLKVSSGHNTELINSEKNVKSRIQLSLAMVSVMIGREQWFQIEQENEKNSKKKQYIEDFFNSENRLFNNANDTNSKYESLISLSNYEDNVTDSTESISNIMSKGLKEYQGGNLNGFLSNVLPARHRFQQGGKDLFLSMQDEDMLQQTILTIAEENTDAPELARTLSAQRSFEKPHSPYVWMQYSRILTTVGEEDASRAAFAYAQNMGWGQKGFGAH